MVTYSTNKERILIKHSKIWLSVILAGALLGGTVFAQSSTKVYVNGMRVEGKVIMDNGTTYVPLRAVGESLGANVSWDAATSTAYVTMTEEDVIAKLVADVSPSVVAIVGNYAGTGSAYQYNNPTVHGSGVIYKSNGYIITNAHVVDEIKNLTVVMNDGTTLPGKVLFSDTDADLAVVKVEKLGLRPVTMAEPETVVSGKTAIAIGTPISLSMRNTVTKGIVSGCDVSLTGSYYKLLQTDAAINPGNSGGPLLNSKGELIGINSSKFVSAEIDNIGFAIPIDTVQYVIRQFETNGYIMRPSFQIEFEESWETKIGLPTQKGITVKKSSVSSLAVGDVVTAVNGIAVHSVADWNEALKETYSGNAITVSYQRNNVAAETKING